MAGNGFTRTNPGFAKYFGNRFRVFAFIRVGIEHLAGQILEALRVS